MKLTLAVAIGLFPNVLFAGTARITDNEGVIHNPPQIVEVVRNLPFDVAVLTYSQAGDRQSFNTYADNHLASANEAVIAIDTKHRWGHMRLGANLANGFTSLDTVMAYGNPHFKGGHFEDGITAIATGIGRAVTVRGPVPTEHQGPTTVTDTVSLPGYVRGASPESHFWVWFFVLTIVPVTLGTFIVWRAAVRYRRRRRQEQDARSYSAPTPYIPYERPTRQASPSTVIVDRGSNVTDLLIADAILNPRQVQPAPAPYVAPAVSPRKKRDDDSHSSRRHSESDSSYSGGSGSSSWGDSSSSSGSSSWGGDSGGGGGDSSW